MGGAEPVTLPPGSFQVFTFIKRRIGHEILYAKNPYLQQKVDGKMKYLRTTLVLIAVVLTAEPARREPPANLQAEGASSAGSPAASETTR